VASVSHEDLTLFTRQLAVMHQAGLSLPRALEFHARSGKREINRVAAMLCAQLENGHKFSRALSMRDDVFSSVYVGLVEVAEGTGELRATLLKLADLLERQHAMRQRIVAQLTYPGILLAVSLLAVAGFVLFVLPLMTPMFASMKMQLPWLTRVVVGVAAFVRAPLTVVVALAVLGVGLGQFVALRRQASRWEAFKRRFDKLVLALPLLGPTVQKIVAARILQVMAAQLQGGMYTGQVLDRTARVAGNSAIADRIRAASLDVKAGDPLSTALARQDILPEGALQMMRAGEESSRLDELLQRAGLIYEDEVDLALLNMTLILEPVILLGLGLVVALVVVAAMLPTVQLLQNL
jgi:general secretion pathway protein F